MTKLTQAISSKISRLLSEPAGELTRVQRTVRYSLELARYCVEQLRRDRAPQMAAALTYRTIFSLVPTLILALLVFRAFVSFDEAKTFLEEKIYTTMALDVIALQPEQSKPVLQEGEPTTTQSPQQAPAVPSPESATATPTTTPAAAEATASKAQPESMPSLTETITGFVEQGYNLNIAGIGIIGLGVLVWSALALIITVEQCFNLVFDCRVGRPWHLRILLYWGVLTLGPVLLMASMYLTGRLYGVASELPYVGALFQTLGSFAALGASWLLLMLLYVLMPNTQVNLRPAMIGAFVAAVLWELGKVGFKFYITHVVKSSVIYGSLGLLPLFLFWVYLTWLFVLFGLELTHVLQTMPGRRLHQQKRTDERDLISDSRYLLPMMTALGESFQRGKAMTSDDLARQLQLSGSLVANFCQRLEREGLIHQLSGGGYTLARPAEHIAVADLLKLSRSLSHLDHQGSADNPGWALLAELNAAETQASANRTLAQVLERSKPED
ncbi:MAG: YihY family inner membrane protein [Phycisphaeraceae bacterium]|nr:YihY family inner membrane protein [Phycisphaeraceae bacterium]